MFIKPFPLVDYEAALSPIFEPSDATIHFSLTYFLFDKFINEPTCYELLLLLSKSAGHPLLKIATLFELVLILLKREEESGGEF